jgi:hypothetical protein
MSAATWLPDELWLEIFAVIAEPRALLAARQVCRAWRALLSDRVVWAAWVKDYRELMTADRWDPWHEPFPASLTTSWERPANMPLHVLDSFYGAIGRAMPSATRFDGAHLNRLLIKLDYTHTFLFTDGAKKQHLKVTESLVTLATQEASSNESGGNFMHLIVGLMQRGAYGMALYMLGFWAQFDANAALLGTLHVLMLPCHNRELIHLLKRCVQDLVVHYRLNCPSSYPLRSIWRDSYQAARYHLNFYVPSEIALITFPFWWRFTRYDDKQWNDEFSKKYGTLCDLLSGPSVMFGPADAVAETMFHKLRGLYYTTHSK